MTPLAVAIAMPFIVWCPPAAVPFMTLGAMLLSQVERIQAQ